MKMCSICSVTFFLFLFLVGDVPCITSAVYAVASLYKVTGPIDCHHHPCKIYITLCRMGKTALNLERPNYVCRPNFGHHVVFKQRDECAVFLW